jgi:hypothetical protein
MGAVERRILELPSAAVIMQRRRQPDDLLEDELVRHVFYTGALAAVSGPSNTLKSRRALLRPRVGRLEQQITGAGMAPLSTWRSRSLGGAKALG